MSEIYTYSWNHLGFGNSPYTHVFTNRYCLRADARTGTLAGVARHGGQLTPEEALQTDLTPFFEKLPPLEMRMGADTGAGICWFDSVVSLPHLVYEGQVHKRLLESGRYRQQMDFSLYHNPACPGLYGRSELSASPLFFSFALHLFCETPKQAAPVMQINLPGYTFEERAGGCLATGPDGA